MRHFSYFADLKRSNWPSWKAAWDWRDMRRELDRRGIRRLSDAQLQAALAAFRKRRRPFEVANAVHWLGRGRP